MTKKRRKMESEYVATPVVALLVMALRMELAQMPPAERDEIYEELRRIDDAPKRSR